MKKFLVSLLVLALCAPAMATTITVTDNADLTATVTIATEGAEPNIVGLALDVTVGGTGTVTEVVSIEPATFNIYPDAAYTQELGTGYVYGTGTPVADKAAAGQVALSGSFALSFAMLNGEFTAGAGGAAEVTVVLRLSEPNSLEVCENALRGGIVAVDGTALEPDPACDTEDITGAAGCKGDITGDTPPTIDALDLSALVVYLTPHAPGYEVDPIPAGDEKYNLNGDTKIDALDLSKLVVHLTPYAPGYETTNCIP